MAALSSSPVWSRRRGLAGCRRGCANFNVQPLACEKSKPTPLGVVTYPGDVVSGRLPAYYIEVTPYQGWSVFAQDPFDGFALKAHLEAAQWHWKSVMAQRYAGLSTVVDAIPFSGDGAHNSMPGDNGGMLYGRTIRVPYGAIAWSFASIGVAGGSVAPVCFDGISEMSPAVWADLPGHGETSMALSHAVWTGSFCDKEWSGLYAPELPVHSPLGSPWDLDSTRNWCAFPQTTPLVVAGVWQPTSEAIEPLTTLNPRKVCAGRLGPHLPRTGRVNTTNEWDAANLVAYRIATLSEDHFLSGPGMEPGDRWQLVWPPALSPGAHQCFRPGAVQALELATDGPVVAPELPGTDGPVRPGGTLATYARGGGSYVFAVWREFSKCVEPGQGALFTAELALHHPAAVAACTLANATDGMP